MNSEHVDVVIVGAGLSGVGAAVHLRKHCPGKSFLLLEGRERAGGTWDLFRYPGVRSDTDMHTLGYKFKPWKHRQAIADGHLIRDYVEEAAREHGVDKKIHFGRKVQRASWSSRDARWTLTAVDSSTGAEERFTCGFLMLCSGYYNYDAGYTPTFEGRERFAGEVVHPQFWPEELDYSGKRVVVIGSGATAMTLVPALSAKAAHVTMLQRSPTYVANIPRTDALSPALRKVLPDAWVHTISRGLYFGFQAAIYQFSRRRPEAARRLLLSGVRRAIGDKVDMRHFTPSYMPWDQRLCAVPDGDLFESIQGGKVSVVTDGVRTFTEDGIALQSGEHLPADIIVTATGLELRLFGGMTLDVDGEEPPIHQTLSYKGVMFAGIPNLSLTLGYTNASWTLRADLVAEYVCHLLNHMDSVGAQVCTPRYNEDSSVRRPLLDMSSGYIARGKDALPRQGEDSPWQMPQSYRTDKRALRRDAVDEAGLEFTRAESTERIEVSRDDQRHDHL